jgi:O-antigen/teichoic acid export membrane protein
MTPRVVLSRLRGRFVADHLVRNSLFIMASTLTGSVLGFAYWAVAARLFDAPAVGLAAGLVSAMTLVSTVATMGLHSGLTQELPVSDPHRWSILFTGSLAAGAATSALGGFVWFAFPLISPGLAKGGVAALFLFVLGAAGATVNFLLDYTFVAERAAEHMLARNAFFGLAKVAALVVAAAVLGKGAMDLFGSWVLVQVLVFGLSAGISVRSLRPDWRPALRGIAEEMRRLIRTLAGHHLTTLGALLPMYVLPLEVVARVSPTANAWFYVTWMLCAPFLMVSPAVSSSLFAEGSHSPGHIRTAAGRSARTVAALLVPAAALYTLSGHALLSVFGRGYDAKGYPLLLVLVASAVPDAVTNVAVSVLRVERRLRQAAVLNVGMAVLALSLAWLLLPVMGIIGAGVAWLTAQTAGTAAVGVILMVRRMRPTAVLRPGYTSPRSLSALPTD